MIIREMGFLVYISALHSAQNKHLFHSVMELTNTRYFFWKHIHRAIYLVLLLLIYKSC